MKRTLLSLLLACTAIVLQAQTPDIRIKTNIYETDGPTNTFTLILGAVPGKTGYADVLCSGGNQSETEITPAYYDEETGGLQATYISCQVDQQGYVEIYCDEGVAIDYICCEGAELTSIEVKHPENVEILALEHNALESLDLTAYTNLTALYLKDNPFNKKPLIVGPNKEKLQILDLSIIDNVDPSFDIDTYPNLQSFVAYSSYSLTHLNPTKCPKLLQLSLDNTNITSLDLSNNPLLRILNISESRIAEIDLTPCKMLQQFYATHSSSSNTDIKLDKIDVTCCPNLIYLALAGNNLKTIDLSKCTYLTDVYLNNNQLTTLDLSHNKNLINVYYQNNNMDFNTMPVPQDTWGDYEYKQRPLSVPHTYQVGTPLDLSSRVIRKDSETFVNLFYIDEDAPYLENELDPSWYTFDNGVITINHILPDSVYASFYNGTFPDFELVTSSFLIKDADSYGKPDLAATIGNSLSKGADVSLSVGLAGATIKSPRTFLVDLGDGNPVEFRASSSLLPETANVVGKKAGNGAIKIYMPDGERFTALGIEGIKLTGLNLDNARQLRALTLTNTKLKSLDLQWNRLLESVDITGNDFGDSFTLAGANGSYGKNFLSHINLSNNNMSDVTLNEPGSWQYIDLSHNRLSSVNFKDADHVQYLDLSHNAFEYIKINYLGELKTFYCNDNFLTELVLPETNVIEYFNCANNCFTFANIPARNGLDESHFLYAPQASIQIPTKGPGYNLSEQNITIEGKPTVFTWKNAAGTTLVEGTDYTCTDGITHFADATIGQTLHCEITNAAYPALSGDHAICTTSMLSAGMPTHLLGEFTTTTGGQEVRLSLTSAVPNNSVYIDWTGTNSLEQYALGTTYTIYTAKTTANARVKVWSYEENDNLTVFSLTNAKLDNVDLSPMKNLIFLGLSYSGINSLKWPESANLQELDLEGCTFNTFDFTRYPKLSYINLDNNRFETINLSGLDRLGMIGLASNRLKEVKFGGNTALWQVALSNNQLKAIDLSGAPNIEQISLDNNQLSSIDLSPLKNLRAIYLDNNRFDFSNLPVPQDQWVLYTYGDQPEVKAECVDGRVDLCRLAERDGVKTEFIWFFGRPTYDYSTGILSGEELVIGEEYESDGGVTAFCTAIDGVCCVMTNALFPATWLQTNLMNVTEAVGIETLAAPSLAATVNGRTITITGALDGTHFTLHALDGTKLSEATATNATAILTAPSAGTYVITTAGAAAKVVVKAE